MVSLAIASLHAFAEAPQAGGGGAFGGGGGGGGGGDVGFLLRVLYWLIRLAIEAPVLGIPLCIAVVLVFAVGTRKGWWMHQERVIRRGAPRRERQRSAAAVALLRERDPAFDEERFLARVAAAFRKAQAAWCAQELEPLRPFVSDAVFERFSLQIAEQREDGWRQGIDRLLVERLHLQHVESGRHFETATVRIPFAAEIHRVRRDTGKRIPGLELGRRDFEECWSFVRRRGARTPTGEGLIEGKCPVCGAPLAMNQSARCASCESQVQSGEFDWVLTEITQAGEWGPEDERAVVGLAAYAERDPGLSTQLLEDRASVAFWRWSAVERSGRVDPLARIADAALCEQVASELAGRARTACTTLGERAVGSVRTLGILTGAERDRALVEVVWDGRPVTLAAGTTGAVVRTRPDKRRMLRRTLFVLARRAGEATPLGEAFTSARCRTCGANDAGGTDPLCPYCGAPRTGDASTWLVSAILEAGDPETRRLRAELAALARPGIPLQPPSMSGLLRWAVAAVRADGRIDARERRAVTHLGEGLGLTPRRVEALLAGGDADQAAPLPRDPEEARAWLGVLCELALADGLLGRAEKAFLHEAARSLGMPRLELSRMLRATRRSLYREARQGA